MASVLWVHYIIFITNSRVYHLVIRGNFLPNLDIVCCFYPLNFSYASLVSHFSIPLRIHLFERLFFTLSTPSYWKRSFLLLLTFHELIVLLSFRIGYGQSFFLHHHNTLTHKLTYVYGINEWGNGWKNKKKKSLIKSFMPMPRFLLIWPREPENSGFSYSSPWTPGTTGVYTTRHSWRACTVCAPYA